MLRQNVLIHLDNRIKEVLDVQEMYHHIVMGVGVGTAVLKDLFTCFTGAGGGIAGYACSFEYAILPTLGKLAQKTSQLVLWEV